MLVIVVLKVEILYEGTLALLKAARDNSQNNDNTAPQAQK